MSATEIHEISHLDGVPWHDAEPPRRKHDCWAQTTAWTGPFGLYLVERCACGAIRMDGRYGVWLERNARAPKAERPWWWRFWS